MVARAGSRRCGLPDRPGTRPRQGQRDPGRHRHPRTGDSAGRPAGAPDLAARSRGRRRRPGHHRRCRASESPTRTSAGRKTRFPGLLGNVAAGRIANRLDLRGTNCVVDAACASSLGAVNLATLELAAGRCDLAVTGGLDTFNDIFMYMCFSKTPALSPTGDARPFDADADGTILGEGLGVLVLKRLDDARRDGDRIYAVIRSMGSSSDGKGQAVYAPSAAGQAKALKQAYRVAGISPATVELVEAHGTGTKVGDAIELAALEEVYRSARPEGSWCALGSVKSQVGHTKAAAGAAGLIKAALALYHKVLPPTSKVRRPIEPLAGGRLAVLSERARAALAAAPGPPAPRGRQCVRIRRQQFSLRPRRSRTRKARRRLGRRRADLAFSSDLSGRHRQRRCTRIERLDRLESGPRTRQRERATGSRAATAFASADGRRARQGRSRRAVRAGPRQAGITVARRLRATKPVPAVPAGRPQGSGRSLRGRALPRASSRCSFPVRDRSTSACSASWLASFRGCKRPWLW